MKSRFLVFGFLVCLAFVAAALPAVAQEQPNSLVVWGDDIGQSNISDDTMGVLEPATHCTAEPESRRAPGPAVLKRTQS